MNHPFTLDHFYIVISSEKFEEIKDSLVTEFNAIHKKVNSNFASWEGLYIRTLDGSYFEILREREPGTQGRIGIALSHRDQKFDTSEYCRKFSFACSELVKRDDEPWFNSIYHRDSGDVPMAYVWIMKYLGKFAESRFQPDPDARIECFLEVDLYTTQKTIEEFALYKEWIIVAETLVFKISNNRNLRLNLKISDTNEIGFRIQSYQKVEIV